MNNPNSLLKIFENFGRVYCHHHLKKWREKSPNENSWEALDFFFQHTFPRGRSDSLSKKYYCFTISILEENLKDEKDKIIDIKKFHEFKFDELWNQVKGTIQRKFSVEQFNDWTKENIINQQQKALLNSLLTKDDNNRFILGNIEDIYMVINTLSFIEEEIEDLNIYKHLDNIMSEKGIGEAFGKLKQIRGIGDKLASLVIRDILLISENKNISKEECKYIVPIDTWTEKLLRKIYKYDKNKKELKNILCERLNEIYEIPLVAAGIWFLSINSFDILIELLLNCSNFTNLFNNDNIYKILEDMPIDSARNWDVCN